jgi:hypothetical protein
MKEKGWTICSFIFTYKNVEYIVLVKRFIGREQRTEEYSLVKLHFIKSDDLGHELKVEASSQRLFVDAKTLREFFGIEYASNLGSMLHQLTEQLGRSVPPVVPAPNDISTIEKNAMVHSLSRSDAEGPNKVYCTHVRRNPNNSERSIFNSNKTKLLRPLLYDKLQNERHISFCYSFDKDKERTDSDILKHFAEDEQYFKGETS